jgi:hypothetical protein
MLKLPEGIKEDGLLDDLHDYVASSAALTVNDLQHGLCQI